MTARYDFIVVGGGIAGVSAAYELAAHGSVCLLEQERQLAYHTTGRSAAISMESYGNQQIRSLTCASRQFFENPPEGLAEHPLWAPRGALIVAQAARVDKLTKRFTAVLGQVPTAMFLDDKQVLELVPYLAETAWSAGIYEPSAFDLDVHGIHGAYLGGLRARGGVVKRETEVLRGEHRSGHWTLHTRNDQRLEAAIVVNAAGAWADEFAERCGVPKVGVRPLRRTILAVDPTCTTRGGEFICVSDSSIVAAASRLAASTGVFPEAGAASAFAGLLKYAEEHPDTAQNAVILITGSGLKDTSIFLSDSTRGQSRVPSHHVTAPLAEALT